MLYYAKQKLKTVLQSNRILAILFHKVDMGNIRDGTKVLFLKMEFLFYIKIYFFFVSLKQNN